MFITIRRRHNALPTYAYEHVDIMEGYKVDGKVACSCPPGRPREARPLPEWIQVHRELWRPDVTPQLLHLEYKEGAPDRYQYSLFCRDYRRWQRHADTVMRQEHLGDEHGSDDPHEALTMGLGYLMRSPAWPDMASLRRSQTPSATSRAPARASSGRARPAKLPATAIPAVEISEGPQQIGPASVAGAAPRSP